LEPKIPIDKSINLAANRQPLQNLSQLTQSSTAIIPSVNEREEVDEDDIISVSSIHLVEVLGVDGEGRFFEQDYRDYSITTMLSHAIQKTAGKMTLEQLINLTTDVAKHLTQKKNLLLPSVYLPAQTVKEGVVKFALLTGKLETVIVRGDGQYDTKTFTAPFDMWVDRTVEKQAFEKILLEFNAETDFGVWGEFSPGSKLGYTKLFLNVYYAPFDVDEEIDFIMYGSRTEEDIEQDIEQYHINFLTPEPSIKLPKDQEEANEFEDDEEVVY
jgi:hemolysin activation/secretion protein